MSFYRVLFSIFRSSFFRDTVCEIGIIFTLLAYFFAFIFLLISSPFLILVFPFDYLNERSKSWFSDSSKSD